MGSPMIKGFPPVALICILAISCGHEWRCEAQVHHVVGEDRGWDPQSNVGEWSAGKIFRVGDKIWFTYSAALESIAELRSREEYESCDISNPIRMYTDGLDRVVLDAEGARYFASTKLESCKKGLKVHVNVLPEGGKDEPAALAKTGQPAIVHAVATGPSPSASARLQEAASILLIVLALFCFMGF